MPWGSVWLGGPVGRDVYINGNYEDIAGTTNDYFAVEYGLNTFETLDERFRVDFRAQVDVNDEHSRVKTELEPVVPPEPTVLTPRDGEEGGVS
jgi:hypothetical protein